MTNPKLKKLLDSQISAASDMIVKMQSLFPMFVLEGSDGEITMLMTPWANQDEKEKIVAAVKAKMKADGTVRYATIMESWMAMVDYKTQPELMDVPPSQRNDRMEVIMVTANDHVDTIAGVREIMRDDKGKVIGTREFVGPGKPDSGFSGRMVELLR